MLSVFSEEAFIEKFLETEAALARAQADVGLIPDAAAEEITAKASLEYLDLETVERNVEVINLFTMPIIEAWEEQFDEHGEYIHWGATSQDISDTAMMLQIREGYEVVQEDLEAIHKHLRTLVKEHRETPIIGRTHHVHAIPITFGLKVATWLDEIERHIDRFKDLEQRLFVATGTLASIEEHGPEVQERFAAELDLAVPDVAWYTSRDRLAELVDAMAGAASMCGRIARQVLVMNRPEVDEVKEPIGEGEVGSSTIPHKKNLVRSQAVVGLSKLLRSHVHVIQELMEGYDERNSGTWQVEFALLPESFLYFERVLQNVSEVREG